MRLISGSEKAGWSLQLATASITSSGTPTITEMMDASAEVIKMGAVLKCHSREYMVPFLHN